MIKRKSTILLSLLVGLIFTLLFFEKYKGISIGIFACILLAFGIYILKQYNLLNKSKYWLFAIPILLLSFRYSINISHALDFFNYIVIFILFIAMSILLVNKTNMNWAHLKFLLDIIETIFRPFKYFIKTYKLLFKSKISLRKSMIRTIILKVMLGLLLSIPFLYIILGLLSSADMVFSSYISSLPMWLDYLFSNKIFSNIFSRFIITIFIGTYIYSYAYAIIKNRFKAKKRVYIINKNNRINFDSTILITVLVVINLVYIFFCFIQFSYLFGGNSNTLPGNFTYSEYARKGFFELIFVTILNFSMILATIYHLFNKNNITKNILKALLLIISATTFVMLYSSFYRMGLYQENYGYTHLRIYVNFFLLVETIALIQTIIYIITQNFNIYKTYIITFIICYLGLNYMNVDKSIAKSNIDMYFETKQIDISYIENLSYERIPDMVRLLDTDDEVLVSRVKQNLKMAKEELDNQNSWAEFNYSKYKAKRILEELKIKGL